MQFILSLNVEYAFCVFRVAVLAVLVYADMTTGFSFPESLVFAKWICAMHQKVFSENELP